MAPRLPIHAVVNTYREAVEQGPVIVTAATGSGKSTEIPRISPRPVIVVEPRRVACRSLAARVAELEGCKLGGKVGYIVRDDNTSGPDTEILFVTPGIALRALEDHLARAQTFILDEVHERSLDVDLLLALVRGRAKRLVMMSATIDADRLAERMGATRVDAPGRTYPVEIEYDDKGPTVPTPDRLAERVRAAVERLGRDAGDTLVFLPGKAEIRAAKSALSKLGGRKVVELHGGLSPREQTAAFAPADQPKVILSTNVAETSVTVPGVRAVIDGGLVRQVRYVQGRGTLGLIPVARDSAEQRAGRAGRTAPGRCIRLWRQNAHLEAHTPPEIHRMSLVPLVLAARAHGRDPTALQWLDEPKAHALDTASEELSALGALDVDGHITERGQALFRLPTDPWIGRVLVEAERAGHLDDAVDLAAALELNRPLFTDPGGAPEDSDPRSSGCDLVALIRGLREGGEHVVPAARAEARAHADRLRRALGMRGRGPSTPPDRDALVQILLAADPRAARIRRERGRKIAWGGAGTEMELDRRSAVELRTRDGLSKLPDAILVLGLRSLRDGARTRLIATAATGVELRTLEEAGLGETRVHRVELKGGRILTELERVFAGKVLSARSEEASRAALREGFATLVERGRLLKGCYSDIQHRLGRARLACRLAAAGMLKTYEGDLDGLDIDLDPQAWLRSKVDALGMEAQEDVQLVDAEDLLPPALPFHLEEAVERDYPSRVDLGEAKYEVQYDLGSKRAVLVLKAGGRHKAPPRRYLPRFPGLKVSIQAGGTMVDLG